MKYILYLLTISFLLVTNASYGVTFYSQASGNFVDNNGSITPTNNLFNTKADGSGTSYNGFRVLSLDEVLYLQGEVNYTRFILKSGEKIITSKTLKEYGSLLEDFGFYRIHQSYIINLRFEKEYIKGEGGIVVMTNGEHLSVSRRRKQQFIARFLGAK